LGRPVTQRQPDKQSGVAGLWRCGKADRRYSDAHRPPGDSGDRTAGGLCPSTARLVFPADPSAARLSAQLHT